MASRQKISTASSLPSELLAFVYDHLSPHDFHAARHTCRKWMQASLDEELLTTMLKRGGWWGSYTAVEQGMTGSTWLLSCRLARECALSGESRGNGLPRSASCVVIRTAEIDLAELATGTPGVDGQSGGLSLTASTCGRFLMAAEGILLRVYELRRDDIYLLTTIICPARVLAVSMNTACNSHSIAALLANRTGLVCDVLMRTRPLGLGRISVEVLERPQATHRNPADLSPNASVNKSLPLSVSSIRGYPSSTNDLTNISSRPTNLPGLSINEETSAHHRSHVLPARSRGSPSTFLGSVERFRLQPHESHWREEYQESTHTYGNMRVFHHLCSPEDPPRSVAICPYRRSVAFGCGAGLEIHWVDALTTRDFSRWFPLTGPSDHLHFLPLGSSSQCPKIIRLVSSAKYPDHQTVIAGKLLTQRRNPLISKLRYPPGSVDGATKRTDECGPWTPRRPYGETASSNIGGLYDYFRSIPLSDGVHVVFIDRASSQLCIGIDAALGPTSQLERHVMLVPHTNGRLKIVTPKLHAAGMGNVDNAAQRIVAVYEDTVVLYSIPVDVLNFSTQTHKHHTTGGYDELWNATADEVQWLDFWPQRREASYRPGATPQERLVGPLWPLYLQGVTIGHVKDAVDLAINEENGLIVWVFTLQGMAIAFSIDIGRTSRVVKKTVITPEGVVTPANPSHTFSGGPSSTRRLLLNETGHAPGGNRVLIGGHGV